MIHLVSAFLSLAVALHAGADMGNCDSVAVNERLPNEITSDVTLSASKVYGIDRRVRVSNNATLTIEAGTTLAGCSLYSYLVIAPGAKIVAKGTLGQPITFTSQTELLGFSSFDGAGEWGGVVIAGSAYTHGSDNRYEADEEIAFGSSDHTHDNDSSGFLEYVVIKHTGFKVKKDKELNGLSLAGVGSGTVLQNIAIIGGKDDGLEIWGGTANVNGLYVYNAMDDSIDADLGYRGTISDVWVEQKRVDSTNNHDSAIMEFGNDSDHIATEETNATLPTIRNLTAFVKGGGIYNKYDAGFRLQNVALYSEKKEAREMIYFRGKDTYTTEAKYLDAEICLHHPEVAQLEALFSTQNSQKPTDAFTAFDYFIKERKAMGKGRFVLGNGCIGGDEERIWKGQAGTLKAL
ncbi:MAG: hypothetical protein JXK05_04250 [Campylobacterales bacterium]|nr:hypothetical protein [Campylobacterales bacterium]